MYTYNTLQAAAKRGTNIYYYIDWALVTDKISYTQAQKLHDINNDNL